MSQLEDLLQQCTVKLTLPGRLGWGTGFFVATGWILTCAHVVREAEGQAIAVRWQQRSNWAQAMVEKLLPDYDLALLRVTLPMDANPPCVYLDEAVESRDPLYLFGYPDEGDCEGEPRTFNCDGITGGEIPAILFNLGQVRPGMSGSPLLNQETGKVCGMVKFTRDRSFDLGGGAIPTRVILEQLPELRELQREFHGGDRRWSDVLAKDSEIDFQTYLGAITRHYEQWWRLYTLMDAEGRQAQKAEPFFDFGLMVERREEREKAEEGREQEKIERLPVLAGLRKYAAEHVLLVGRPGSGKSTALARLMLETAADGRIPVLVELRSWQSSVLELIRAFFQRHELVLTIADIQRLLDDRKLLLLIDGVNELSSEAARTDVANFRRHHPKVPMIFTTRDLSLGGDLGIEKKLEMQPLTETQMQAFVQAYIPEKAEAMLRQLKERLRDFGKTPLLLWMLCEVFDQTPNQQLPNNLAEIFQLFTRMYEDSSLRKYEVAVLKGDVRPLSDRRLWKPALMHLASVMMEGKERVDFRVVIDRNEAEKALQEAFLNESFPIRDILDDLLKFHLMQYRTSERIEFRHQLIQEYYAAEWLLARVGDLDDCTLKRNYLNYLKWTEPVALMLALMDDEALAVRVVEQALDVDLMLGARLAGEVRSSFQEWTVPLIHQQKIRKCLKVLQIRLGYQRVKLPFWLLAELLVATDSEAAVPILTIKSSEKDTHGAIFTLGRIGSERAIPYLLHMLENSNDSVSSSAAFALARIGSEQVIPYLLHMLENSNDSVSSSAAFAFSYYNKIKSEKILPRLFKMLEHSKSDLRRQAVWYKRKRLAKQERNVVKALGYIGSEAAIPALITALQDPDSDVRRSAAIALGQIGSEAAIPYLLTALQDTDPDVRGGVAIALGRIDSETAIPILLTALKDKGSDMRGNLAVSHNAALTLGQIGSETAISALLTALADSNWKVRENASFALANSNAESVVMTVQALLKRIKDIDTNVRRRTISSLGQIVLEMKALASGVFKRTGYLISENVRESAADILMKLDFEAIIDALLDAIKDSNLEVRMDAAFALGQVDKPVKISTLLKTVKDLKSFLCLGIAFASGKIMSLGLNTLMLTGTRIPTVRWRVSARASALAEKGSRKAIHTLQKQINHSDIKKSEAAVAALSKVKDDRVAHILPDLLTLLPTESGRTAFEVIQAIQANCKYYNYELFHSPPANPQPTQQLPPTTTINIAGD